jgi:PAS domain S-box-containing protein
MSLQTQTASAVHRLSLSTAEPSVRLCLNALSRSLQAFQRSPQIELRIQALDQLQEDLNGFRNLLQLLRLQLPVTISLALRNLFAALASNLDHVNASSLRTAARSIDFLNRYISSEALFSDFADSPLEVLIIDDNDVCRKALKLALRSRELKVTECASGEEALKALEGGHFELVFSDIMMPRIDGFALASAFRKLPGYSGVPLIFVTALSDFETRSKSIVKGCVDLIAKPFIPSEVVLKALTVGWGARLDRYLNPPKVDRVSGRDANPDELSLTEPLTYLRGVLCMELDGRIKTVNDDCCQVFGCPAPALVGRNLRELLPESLQTGEHARHLQDVLAGKSKIKSGLVLVGLHKNSEQMPLLVSISETLSQGQRLLVAVLRHATLAEQARKEVSAPEPKVEAPSAA